MSQAPSPPPHPEPHRSKRSAALGKLFQARVLLHPLSAALLAVIWIIPMILIKLRLLDAFILTSDIAYYGNMLYNTGLDLQDRTFRILYTTHDVLRFSSTSFLTEHFSPTFALLAPLFQLLPNPLFLTVAQPILIAVAGMGLFRLTQVVIKRYDAPEAANVFPLTFLVMYLVNASNVPTTADSIYGFHHDSLIPPLMAWGLVFALQARWRLALITLLLLLGVKENLPIVISAFFFACLPFGWLVPRKKAAIGIILCMVFFAGCYWFQFRTENRHVGIVYRFFDLDSIFAALGMIDRWPLVLHLWPAWFALPILLPGAAEFSLQLMGATVQYDWHSYPLIMLSMIGTILTLTRLTALRRHSPVQSVALVVVVLGLMAAPIVADGVRTYRNLQVASLHLPVQADAAALAKLAEWVPADAKLLTTSDLLVFFAKRRHLLWPESGGFADHILINLRSEEDNRKRAEAFARANPGNDPGTQHFFSDVGIVLSGYLYDTNLISYVQRREAEKSATVVQREGDLVLYRLAPDASLPSMAASPQ
jgi:uncharacterized membrane protein